MLDVEGTKMVEKKGNTSSRTVFNIIFVVLIVVFICQSFFIAWLWCSGRVQLTVDVQRHITESVDGRQLINYEVIEGC